MLISGQHKIGVAHGVVKGVDDFLLRAAIELAWSCRSAKTPRSDRDSACNRLGRGCPSCAEPARVAIKLVERLRAGRTATLRRNIPPRCTDQRLWNPSGCRWAPGRTRLATGLVVAPLHGKTGALEHIRASLRAAALSGAENSRAQRRSLCMVTIPAALSRCRRDQTL